MKKNITSLSLLLLLSIAAAAQTDTTGIDQIAFSDSTAHGAADGKLTSKEIGTGGGKIISDDGRIELIFPAGALTTATTISIQPTINLAPNGTGKSYRFEPSGLQFKKPVQFIFHYTNEEDETCPADLMAFAMQDHTGKWSFSDYETWDSLSKTLKGYIQHFSTASNIEQLKLQPDKRTLQVNKTALISVLDVNSIVKEGPYKGNYDLAILLKEDIITWYVNDKIGGNDLVGKVSTTNMGYNKKGKFVLEEYTAPKFLPLKNPVSIALKIKYRSPKTKKWVTKILSCTIGIYDAYKVKVTATAETRISMKNEILDSATFIIYIYDSYYRIENIKNYPPVLTKEGKQIAGCKLKIYLADALGIIHITEPITNYRMERLLKDGPPEITFDLPVDDILVFQFQVNCRGIKGGIDPLISTSLAVEVNFIANGQEQSFTANETQAGGYKVKTTPYRD